MKKLFSNELVRNIIFLAAGVALTACSFCAYLLPEDKNWTLIIVLSAVDLIFMYLNAVIILDESDYKWLKAPIIAVIYLAVFNAAPAIYLLFNDNLQTLSEIWQDVLMYSFFCGPMLIILIIIASVIAIIHAWLQGHTIK